MLIAMPPLCCHPLCELCKFQHRLIGISEVVLAFFDSFTLTTDAAKTLTQAFVSCRLDYCNSLLYGVSDGLMRKLQSIQNASARLITGVRLCDHITHVLS